VKLRYSKPPWPDALQKIRVHFNRGNPMRFSPIKFLHGLLYMVPVLVLALAACGGGGGGSGGGVTVTPPAAPIGVSAANASGCYARIQISWTAATSATGYNIYRSATSTVTKASTKLTTTVVTASPYIDTALTVNGTTTTYYYAVTAINSAGESPVSATVNAAIPATVAPCLTKGGSLQGNPLALSGTVTTLAGKSGLPGATDATGISAQFNGPSGIATDGTNIYVADTANNVIRKIDSSGAVTTVAGSVTIGSADSPTGTSATFHLPSGITTDGTNLYVADTANHLIRKITLLSPFAVTTVAGTGTAGSADSPGASFSSPIGITSDGPNLYVADTANHTIRKILISSGAVTTVAGLAGAFGITDGTGAAARFKSPQGITTDGTYLYVADTANHLIRKIDLAGTVLVSTVAGTVVAGAGTAGSADGTGAGASFSSPIGITTDGTYLYDADNGTSTIRRIQ
jgi:sugar lactone lactonase YvrE